MNQQMNQLNVISPKAKIGKNVEIGPFTTIEDDVEIGDNTWIGSNVAIMNGVRIGDNCKIFPGAILGAKPQDLKFENEQSILEIGNNVVIREYCTINRGTKANFKTIISDNCLLMAYVHVAHDCVLGKNCIIANSVNLAGHIELESFVRIGGMTAVHQFVKIGTHSFIGGGSLVRKDVPPFVKAAREPLSYVGVNTIGLQRAGFAKDAIHRIQDIYRMLFVKNTNVNRARKQIAAELPDSNEKSQILDFIDGSERGLMRGFKQIG